MAPTYSYLLKVYAFDQPSILCLLAQYDLKAFFVGKFRSFTASSLNKISVFSFCNRSVNNNSHFIKEFVNAFIFL